ncbi:MAG TPA: hypothetical protein VNO52_17530 [Methylomirabilota bacterium]|nr:hypothetical protein [Methylomirabilota bacterium]
MREFLADDRKPGFGDIEHRGAPYAADRPGGKMTAGYQPRAPAAGLIGWMDEIQSAQD